MSGVELPPEVKAVSYHHGDLRKALLIEARERVERGGADGLSLAAIAKAVGVSQGAPYRHFSGRDELLATIATEGFGRFAAELEGAVKRGSGEPLKALGRAYVAFAIAHPGLYQLMFASRLLAQSEEGGSLKAASYECFDILAKLVAEREPGRRAIVSLATWAGLHGTAMLTVHDLVRGNPSGIELDALISGIVRGSMSAG